MLFDKQPLNFATVGFIFRIEPKTLYLWYRNYLSSYTQEVSDGSFHRYDGSHSDGSVMPVPILKQENIGESMVLDEKMINDEIYTLLSNAETGKIALLAQTVQLGELTKLTGHFGESLKRVKYINSDMAPVYLRFCKESFPDAVHTADKFHVISNVIDTLQSVRMRLKNEELVDTPTKRRGKELDKKQLEEIRIHEERLSMLRYAKYLLCKRSAKWKPWQKDRAKKLFDAFPTLGQAYQLVERLRDWYDRKNIGKKFLIVENDLLQWIEDVEQSKITEMKGLVKMFEKHLQVITNFCITGQSNAMAENINSRIQRFINVNYGVRDINFFFFRVKNYFA